MLKPGLARGMRDFTPFEVNSRMHIFEIIKSVYRKFGFMPLETPVIENLNVLLGKYGEEGDKLIFRILDSGEYLKEVSEDALLQKDYKQITSLISDKGLRYDLTVPLARYVAVNRNELSLPFKRYQIDKVWRADRPQKGRYREFYQCDGDIIGSYSMLYDAECILIFDDVLSELGLSDFTIHLNNRKILSGIAEEWGFADKFNSFAIAIDKWDKIGEEGVVRELGNQGFTETQIHKMQQVFRLTGNLEQKLDTLNSWFINSETGRKGVSELKEVLRYLHPIQLRKGKVQLDLKLARGLDYYTSTIYEVSLDKFAIGSIASGGRYDELTAAFGVPDMPGVGISFGAERIYDILKELNLLPQASEGISKVMFVNFGGDEELHAFKLLDELRNRGIASEMYPSSVKLGKQFAYAEKKGIRYVLILGSDEIKNNEYTLKDLISGTQNTITGSELFNLLSI